jgi:hypothetical protein
MKSRPQLIWDFLELTFLFRSEERLCWTMEVRPVRYQTQGYCKGLSIQGKVILLWSVLDERGMLRHLKTLAFTFSHHSSTHRHHWCDADMPLEDPS